MGCAREQPADRAQHRRLARARLSHQTAALPCFDAEAHPVHGVQRTRATPEDDIEIRYLDHRRCTIVHRAQAESRSSNGSSGAVAVDPRPTIQQPLE